MKKKDIVLPAPQKQEESYHIETKDISKINSLIYSFCSTLERTSKTYENNGKEDIRNMFLAMLNTQYSNATGETFSNKGKTDIYIGHYNKTAYIAECKWKGEQVLLEAIEQLLGYDIIEGYHCNYIWSDDPWEGSIIYNEFSQEIELCEKKLEEAKKKQEIDENQLPF